MKRNGEKKEISTTNINTSQQRKDTKTTKKSMIIMIRRTFNMQRYILNTNKTGEIQENNIITIELL